ncbi:hypothetical protein OSTOST_13719, partial [Ostertagia ostertagi]
MDLHDASGYVMTQPLEDVLAALRPDYCLVDFGEESVAVCVLIDSASADKALAQDLVTALAEGRKPEYGRILVFPKQELRQVACRGDRVKKFRWLWNYRRVKLTLEENVMENIHYLRTDVVCAVGVDCRLEKRYPGMFELMLTSCSSHYNVDRELKKLAEAFLDLTDILASGIAELCSDVRRTYDSVKMRDSVHWTLIQAFNFAFQVLKADVEECKRLVLGDKDAITVTPRRRSSTMSSRKTSDEISSKLKKVSLESRRARLEAAALETDAKVAKRWDPALEYEKFEHQDEIVGNDEERMGTSLMAMVEKQSFFQSAYPMGRVVTRKHDEFRMENYMDPSKTAPFKYQILEKL